MQIYVKPIDTCNLNCQHCYTSGNNGKTSLFDSAKTSAFIKKLLDQRVTPTRIVLHGGEPMLAPVKVLSGFLDDLLQHEFVNTLGIQTNLAYKLDAEKLSFFNKYFLKFGLGTSWDSNIRFGHVDLVKRTGSKTWKNWEDNVRTLSENGHNLSLMVCLSTHLIKEVRPETIIEYAVELGVKNILFERITSDGSATEHSSIFPDNNHLNDWLVEMYQVTISNEYYKIINNMLLTEIATAFLNRSHIGNRCRDCEVNLVTISANGNVSGCPNSADTEAWVTIENSSEEFLKSPKRIGTICKERVRNPICLTCEVRDICNGDCYKLPWQGDTCAAPKKLFKMLKENNDISSLEKLL